MTQGMQGGDGWRGSWLRKAAWSGALVVLLLPLVAMQFTNDVNWTAADFVFAAILLFGSLGAFELATRVTPNLVYRVGAGTAIGTLFLLTWSNAAVGITDSEADFFIFWGVPAVAIIGAGFARFRPGGTGLAMFAAASAQGLIAATALAVGIIPEFNSVFEILGINGFFVVLFAAAGFLFRRAAREMKDSGPAPSA